MVQIISDSSTLYTPQSGAKKGIGIAPLNIIVDGKSRKDLEELSSTQLLQMIKEKKVPTSSQPAIGEKTLLYEEAAKKGPVLDITMAKGLSGTYDSARMAKNMLEENGDKVTVWNSRTLCGPQRALVDYANRLAQKGEDTEQIVAALDKAADTEISFLVPRDFSFLERGGRVNKLEAGAGKLLRLVPTMIKSKDGTHLENFSISRTFKKALAGMIAEMRKRGVTSQYTFFVSHAFNEEDALKAEEQLKAAFPGARIVLLPLSPAFITQGGPGCIAIQAIDLPDPDLK